MSLGVATSACYPFRVQRDVRVFDGFSEADEADRQYYDSLEPQQRVDILLELVQRYRESLGEAAQRFERVHRIVELSES